jgi:PAS domain S-box-containing protein
MTLNFVNNKLDLDVFPQSPFDLIFVIDFAGNLLKTNLTGLHSLGLKKAEVTDLNILSLLPDNEKPSFAIVVKESEKTQQLKHLEFKLKKKGGDYLYLEAVANVIPVDNHKSALKIIARDTSKEKRLSDLLDRSEQKFIDLADQCSDMLLIMSKNRILYSNRAAESFVGYSASDLTSPDLNFETIIAPECRNQINVTLQNALQGSDQPTEKIAFLHKNGQKVYVRLTAQAINYQDQPASCLISTSITKINMSDDDELLSAAKLVKAITSIIDVLSSTMQLRDPYTSGHQQRVTQLASAIATGLGLPENTIRGITLAAKVHDVGKIYLPAEILSKPPPLNDFEMNMIKMHPRAGFDILKRIDFPWPIPEVALEHHERLDGSGYPNHMLGENILLESKVVAVADVVEAISAHRPYRASRGIDSALVHVMENKNRLYDARVVDSCLNLFYDKGFTFEATAGSLEANTTEPFG